MEDKKTLIDSLTLPLEDFNMILKIYKVHEDDFTFLRECYEAMIESYLIIGEYSDRIYVEKLNQYTFIGYLIRDFYYRVQDLTREQIEVAKENEDFILILMNTVLDKYSSLTNFSYNNKAIYTSVDTPITSLNVYANFILNKLDLFKKQDPSRTLIIDMLSKAFVLCKTITTLLVNGFETEALTTWRTLHETEATLILLIRHGLPLIEAYLRHMRYGAAYNLLYDKETTDKIFVEIKTKLKDHNLKSKDIKRFIEYGWLYEIKKLPENYEVKLNFRDGIQKIAGLEQYSNTYQRASEVTHSSPLLFYSRRDFFGRLTIVNLYEAFLRIEEIFYNFYVSVIESKEKETYELLRKVYLSELHNILKQERKLMKK